jgi:phosphoribosylformylglycinamidine synthase
MIAVAEAARNIVCSGGKPLAVTNCLNFGNPYKPEVYYTFSEAVAGMGEACRVLGTPVTGGNVSFYNEDPQRAVFPTPTIGMVGLVAHTRHITTQWFKDDGDIIFLLGHSGDELGGSEFLQVIHEKTRGLVPALDLEIEKRLQTHLLTAIQQGIIKSAHDVSDGGLAIALAECCISNHEDQHGAAISLDDQLRPDSLLFGESQSRVIITASPDNAALVQQLFEHARVPIERIGTVGGTKLTINGLVSVPLDSLSRAFYNAMPHFMEKVG